MGQQEIYLFLQKHRNKWFSAKDIAEKINNSVGSIRNNLKRLRKTMLIKCKVSEETTKHAGVRKVYVYKFE